MAVSIFKAIMYLYYRFRHREVDYWRRQGCKIGKGSKIILSDLDTTHPELIEIGKNTLITHAAIYTHDSSTRLFTGGNPYSGGLRKIGKVKIGNNCFIGHGAVVLPGITIGDYSIIGVNAVVTRDIPPNTVAVGVPAKKICTTKEYIKKIKKLKGGYERV